MSIDNCLPPVLRITVKRLINCWQMPFIRDSRKEYDFIATMYITIMRTKEQDAIINITDGVVEVNAYMQQIFQFLPPIFIMFWLVYQLNKLWPCEFIHPRPILKICGCCLLLENSGTYCMIILVTVLFSWYTTTKTCPQWPDCMSLYKPDSHAYGSSV